MSDFAAVLGLEIHVQLDTKSKMFCRCNNNSEKIEPNTHVCPVCLGLPGSLPVPNRTAVEWALKTALALGCAIPEESKFDRKQYFYPDLPKGYQISQFDQPFGGPGTFEFDLPEDTGPFTVGITRLHLEEDAGKLTHPAGADHSLVDLNRAGTPLMEIVTDPIVVEDPERVPSIAKAFLQELRLVMRYLEVSSADMEKGHLRCDANISLHPKGSEKWGAKVEVKNMNSFRFVERALKAEIERQREALTAGEEIAQETRGYDEESSTTYSQRGKEEAHDYRYFPEPDIPPLETAQLDLDRLKGEIPELPVALRRRWREQGLSTEVIEAAVSSREEAVALASVKATPELVSKVWLSARESLADPTVLAEFTSETVARLEAGTLQTSQVKTLAGAVAASGKSVAETVARDPAFTQVDDSAVESAVQEAIAANPAAVADFKGGNENAVNVIMGAVMKATKGSANPTTVRKLVSKSLEEN